MQRSGGSGGDGAAGDTPRDTLLEAETQPFPVVGSPPPRWTAPGTRWPRRWRRLAVVAGLAVFLAISSTVLAVFGSVPWPFGSLATAALSTRTPAPTPTFTPTATPTLAPTAPATATQNPLMTGGIDLGCGSPAPRPAPYVVRSGTTAYHEVALTFDDGPSADWTPTILTTLEQTHTPATFFVVGASAQARPGLIAREAADGFTIAIHTWDHPYMTQLTPAQRAWELSSTAQAIHAALGPHYCLPYWRPPFGDYNGAVFGQAQAMGLTTVTWNVDPQDWSGPGISVIVDRVLGAAQSGSIIILHDGYANRWQTARALPLIIQGLQQRGLVPVTLAQLLSGTPPPAAPSPTATTAPTATATSAPTATAAVTPTDTPTP